MTSRLVRRIAMWLLATMAAVALHGTSLQLADAWRGDGGRGLMALCTTQGVRWVQVDAPATDASRSDAPAADDGMGSCPLCRLMAEPVLHLDRADLVHVPPAAPCDRTPLVLGPDPSEPPHWLFEPPRGPPRTA